MGHSTTLPLISLPVSSVLYLLTSQFVTQLAENRRQTQAVGSYRELKIRFDLNLVINITRLRFVFHLRTYFRVYVISVKYIDHT
jgi:hypothetical protein